MSSKIQSQIAKIDTTKSFETLPYAQASRYLNDIYMAIFNAPEAELPALRAELSRMIDGRESYEAKVWHK
jgi:hypothetical protein